MRFSKIAVVLLSVVALSFVVVEEIRADEYCGDGMRRISCVKLGESYCSDGTCNEACADPTISGDCASSDWFWGGECNELGNCVCYICVPA